MRAVVTLLTLCAFIVTALGCHSTNQFLVSERGHIKESQKIYKIEKVDGKILRFDSDPMGYAVLRDTAIERSMKDGSIEVIPLSSVKLIHTKQPDPVATTICIALGIGGVALLAIAVFGHGITSH